MSRVDPLSESRFEVLEAKVLSSPSPSCRDPAASSAALDGASRLEQKEEGRGAKAREELEEEQRRNREAEVEELRRRLGRMYLREGRKGGAEDGDEDRDWRDAENEMDQDEQGDEVGSEEEEERELRRLASAEDDGEKASVENEHFTDDELRLLLSEATRLKTVANSHFTASPPGLNEAIDTYKDALACIPPGPVFEDKARRNESETDMDTFNVKGSEETRAREGEERKASQQQKAEETDAKGKSQGQKAFSPLDEECAAIRAIINANLGACYLKKEDWKSAVKACSAALDNDPNYVKALHRRAVANENIGSWSSLAAAEEDVKKLSDLPDLPASLKPTVGAALKRLPPLVAEAAEREKSEMLGKLKGFGNSILGRFGLSTDNFQFTQQPGGGYSMNFVR